MYVSNSTNLNWTTDVAKLKIWLNLTIMHFNTSVTLKHFLKLKLKSSYVVILYI